MADDPSPPTRHTGFSSGPPPASLPAGGAPSYNSVPPPHDKIQLAKQRAQEIAARLFNAAEAKRPRVDNGDDDFGIRGGSFGGSSRSDGGDLGFSSSAGGDHGFSSSAGGGHGASIPPLSSQSNAPQYSSYGGYQGTSKKIEIPSGRVNADAGSPQSGAEQFQMKIGNTPHKVGLVIGKGGETIKSMQAKSGGQIKRNVNTGWGSKEESGTRWEHDKHRGSPKTPTCLLPINSSISLCTPTTSSSPSFRLKNIFMLLLLFTHLQLSSLVVGWKYLFSKL